MSHDGDSFQLTRLVKRQCFVYKIPPLSQAKGYKAGDWDLTNPLWTGRLVITSQGENCFIRLENEDGSEFANCAVTSNKSGPQTVERVVDSSRYFVLRIDNGAGRTATVGMGFNERNDAFDFSAAIQDHQTSIEQKKEAKKYKEQRSREPSKDYSLPEGKTISIHIKTKKSNATGRSRRKHDEDDDNDDDDSFILPPPPGSSPAKNAPKSAPVSAASPSTQRSSDVLSLFDPPAPSAQSTPFGAPPTATPFSSHPLSPMGAQPYGYSTTTGNQYVAPSPQPASTPFGMAPTSAQSPFGSQPANTPFGVAPPYSSQPVASPFGHQPSYAQPLYGQPIAPTQPGYGGTPFSSTAPQRQQPQQQNSFNWL